MTEEYDHIVYRIPSSKEDIFKYKEEPIFSTSVTYPQFSLGFQHFIHQTISGGYGVDKMNKMIADFKGKKKVYLIMNQFERYIDDYDSDINNISKAYFDVEPKPTIVNKSFYKLWELFFMFDLIDLKQDKFTTVCLDDEAGALLQSVLLFRDKFSNKGVSKNDKYYLVDTDYEGIKKSEKTNKAILDYYKKEKPLRVINQTTLPKEKATLVIANGKYKLPNRILYEQETFRILLEQLLNTLKIQEKNGSFIIKIYESFTNLLLKYVIMLTNLYDDVHVVKPLTSSFANMEKYIVCQGFKDPKTKAKVIDQIENILQLTKKNSNVNIVDYFAEYNIESELKNTFIKLNTELSNNQFTIVNSMIDFVSKQNYRGEEYNKRRQIQINATKYWLDNFFPSNKEITEKHKKIMELTNTIATKNSKKVTEFMKRLDN